MNAHQQRSPLSTILVIEDNASQRKTLIDILETEGMCPIGCASGHEGIAMCQQHDVHVAILDLNLPDMNGLAVLTQLKQHIPDMKVIINTAYATLDSAMEAVNREAFAYIQKMGDIEELLTHVHRAFHAHLVGYSEVLEREVNKRTAELSVANAALQQEIEERNIMNEHIRTLNEELELRVRQRTAELELSNRELKDFTYIVSHDLKAPLRGIRRIIAWLLEDYTGMFDEQGKEMLDLLTSRVHRMDALIDGILQYSRIGRITRDHESVDLNMLITDIINMLAPPHHIHIRITTPLPTLVCDRIHLEQIFQNLLNNSIKYMDKSEGRIEVACRSDASPWIFSIADNGMGIEERHHERIFQIFQTLRPHEESGGTGIGLTIVKRIIELYGGKIWIESVPEEGTTFYFTLPHSSEPNNIA